MKQALRIVQITDCHLSGDPDKTYRGVNSHQNLQALLEAVKRFDPHLLLLTGDLSEDASPASYQALQAYFAPLGVPVLALPGNHDDAGLLAEAFPGSPVDSVAVSRHGRWQIIRVNSCVEGKPEGRLSRQTLKQLNHVLLDESHRPKLLALHHQPIPANSPWIDKYRLLEPEALLGLIAKTPGIKVVVWGHVHQVCEAEMGEVCMLGGPSSAINSLPGMQRFTADSTGPACRWLKLGPDGSFSHGIIAA